LFPAVTFSIFLVSVHGPAAAATIYTQAYAQANKEVYGDNYAEDSSGGDTAKATAIAARGLIRAGAEARVSDGGLVAARSIVDYRDTFRVVVWGPVTSFVNRGFMDTSVNIAGISSGIAEAGDGSAWAYVSGGVGVNITSQGVNVNRSEDLSANTVNGVAVRGPSGDVQEKNLSLDSTQLPWSSSDDVTLQISLNVFASAKHKDRISYAQGEYGNTIAWGGITQIYDENMTPLDMSSIEVTALSSDGFDYANAAVVPLPASFWLLLSGIGGVLTYRSRCINLMPKNAMLALYQAIKNLCSIFKTDSYVNTPSPFKMSQSPLPASSTAF
jgi:hypothetical protein